MTDTERNRIEPSGLVGAMKPLESRETAGGG